MKEAIFLFLTLGILTTSCTKEEYITPEDPYQRKISSFKVVNTPEVLEATVSETDKQIVLVLPYYLGLTAVELDIKALDGYTLIDNPHNDLIEDVTEYLLNKKEPLIYTFKNDKGELFNYSLKMKAYQPDISVNELYNEGDPMKEYPRTAKVDWGDGPQVYENSIWFRSGDIIKRVNGTEVTKVFFIDAQGNEFELKNISTSRTGIYAYFPENMALGEYHIRVENYSKSVALERPVRLIKMYGEV
ncbi:hypothetical protein AAG747_03075 [Rapidithrix thailandica]|uniref:Uncharacterized protein n=1 Tax=Rapidithrix thailandica TaxID=413964 RepID=A0AAW9S804_9BACT